MYKIKKKIFDVIILWGDYKFLNIMIILCHLLSLILYN